MKESLISSPDSSSKPIRLGDFVDSQQEDDLKLRVETNHAEFVEEQQKLLVKGFKNHTLPKILVIYNGIYEEVRGSFVKKLYAATTVEEIICHFDVKEIEYLAFSATDGISVLNDLYVFNNAVINEKIEKILEILFFVYDARLSNNYLFMNIDGLHPKLRRFLQERFKRYKEENIERVVDQCGDNLLGDLINSYKTPWQVKIGSLRMIKLEESKPGTVRFLFEHFGIREFYRYPVKMLVDQMDEYAREGSYGVIIYPHNDYNGAFSQHSGILENFHETVAKRDKVRIYEVGTSIDIARILLTNKSLYQDTFGNKPRFLILGGHGSADTITFTKKVLSSDLEGRGTHRLKDFFAQNLQIVLVSCSTGVEGGIGQKISEVLGVKVVAPLTPTNISSLTMVYPESGSPTIDVEYRQMESKRRYASGKPEHD